MQYSSIVLFVTALLGSAVAQNREQDALRVVGNHYGNKAASSYKKSNDNFYTGDGTTAGLHMAQGRESHRIAGQINGAIGGVAPVRYNIHAKRGLEFLGSDNTHEYFARSLDTEEDFELYY